jgi:hypothetical protein
LCLMFGICLFLLGARSWGFAFLLIPPKFRVFWESTSVASWREFVGFSIPHV